MTELNVTPSMNPDSANSQPTGGVLDQLVGPGKKFATVEDLAVGKAQSDSFVDKITTENRELRNVIQDLAQKVDRLGAQASILDRATQQQSDPVNQYGQSTTPAPVTPAPGISTDDVVKLIEASKQQDVARQNIREADAALIKALGAAAPAFVMQRASELNMDVKDLYQVATKSPSGFLGMLGINPNGASNGASMYVQTNNGLVKKEATPIRNQSYYDGLKKQMGNTKFVLDKNLQIQLHKDMQALGDAYFS